MLCHTRGGFVSHKLDLSVTYPFRRKMVRIQNELNQSGNNWGLADRNHHPSRWGSNYGTTQDSMLRK